MFQNVPIPSPVARHLGCFQVLVPFLKTASVIIFAQKPTYHRRDGQKEKRAKKRAHGRLQRGRPQCSRPAGHSGCVHAGTVTWLALDTSWEQLTCFMDGVLCDPGRFVVLSVCGTAEHEP